MENQFVLLSDTGQLPDGLISQMLLYLRLHQEPGISANTDIKLAKTLNDAINDTPIVINEKGGSLKVVSRVSDKNAGDIGHPIQYDTTNSQWYVKVATAATENNHLSNNCKSWERLLLENATPRTFI